MTPGIPAAPDTPMDSGVTGTTTPVKLLHKFTTAKAAHPSSIDVTVCNRARFRPHSFCTIHRHKNTPPHTQRTAESKLFALLPGLDSERSSLHMFLPGLPQ